jgi:ABC-type nickel/cobalt efflux system permease component RcnA
VTGPLVVLVWAGINFVLWVISWAIFEPDAEAVAVYASGILIIILTAAVGFWRTRRVRVPADRLPEATPDVSHAAALLGIAVAMGALSTEFGPWLAYGAFLALVFALGGLFRELRAQREQQHEVRRRHPYVSERVTKSSWEGPTDQP